MVIESVLSVRLSVTFVIHAYKRFKIAKYISHRTIEQSFCFFLSSNFMVVSLWVHPERVFIER